MKKLIRISIILFLLVLSFANINKTYAFQSDCVVCDNIKISKVIVDPDAYNPSKSDISEADKEIVVKKAGVILGGIRNISVIIAVLTIMIVGFKYIIGSVEEKAKYKETLIPLVIGIIIITAGTTLVSYIYNIF